MQQCYLQSEEDGVIKFSTAAAEVGLHHGHIGRVHPMVGHLVGVG